MAIWQVEVWEDLDDKRPSRRGYIDADTDFEAEEAAIKDLAATNRSVLDVKAERASSLPRGRMFWE